MSVTETISIICYEYPWLATRSSYPDILISNISHYFQARRREGEDGSPAEAEPSPQQAGHSDGQVWRDEDKWEDDANSDPGSRHYGR